MRSWINAVAMMLLLSAAVPSLGEEYSCRLCDKPIPSGKEIPRRTADDTLEHYRCIHCAITAQAAEGGAAEIATRSGVDGTPILIKIDADGWHVQPEGAVFLALPEEDGECMERHQAFVDRSEFDRYLDRKAGLPAAEAEAFSIDDLTELLVAGLPRDRASDNATVELLIVGMVSHLPFKQSVQPEIEQALEPVADRVVVRWVDATGPAGRAILESHGIEEHLPVVMWVDGERRFETDGVTIDLSGFPGERWSAERLLAILQGKIDAD